MTHEETVTFHAREIQSYKELPQLWYHFPSRIATSRGHAAACSASASSS